MHNVIGHLTITILALFILVSAILLILKYRRNGNLGAVAAALPRLYVVLVAMLYLFTHNFPVEYIHLGVIFIFISDIYLHLLKLREKKYDHAIELNEQIKALTALEAKFASALEYAQIGFYIINDKGKFEYINPVFCEITEYSRAELLTMSVYDITPKVLHKKVNNIISKKLNGDAKYTDEVFCIDRKHSGPITIRAIGTRTENGHPTVTGNITIVTRERGYGD